MKGLVRPVSELDADAVAAWRELAARAVQPNPLFEPDCLVPAARYLPNGSDILVVTAEEAGAWHGCIPVQVHHRWRALRRPVLVTQVRRMTYDATPLVDAARAPSAMAAMLSALVAGSRTRPSPLPGLVVFDWIDDGPVVDQLLGSCEEAGLACRTYHRWERPMLHRAPDGDYRRAHSKKSLYNLARSRRRLAAALGADVTLVDRSHDPEAVELVLAFEAAGYKGRHGLAVSGRPGEPQWFAEMCDRFRAAGRLHVHSLDVGDRPVALQLLLRGGEGLFLLKIVYDEALGEYSPGNQLHLDAADHLHRATDASWVDTCTYEGNETLLRIFPDRRGVSSVAVATGGPVDSLTLRGVTWARQATGRAPDLVAVRRGRPSLLGAGGAGAGR